MLPLVLLDVDGVLNAVARRPDPVVWSDWQRGRAVAAGQHWPVLWSPSVVAAVRGWLEIAEVQWLTTWGHDANGSLRELLGLPELVVAGTPDGSPSGGAPSERPAGTDALAEVTPAAPDPLTGQWWKFDVVRAVVAAQPGRRIAWVDDDLAGRDDVRAYVQARTPALCLAPLPTAGLRPGDLDVLDWWLRQP